MKLGFLAPVAVLSLIAAPAFAAPKKASAPTEKPMKHMKHAKKTTTKEVKKTS